MTHCTANIGWYIGKFVLSVSAILFIYWGFLKEKEIECYCGAIERESQREPTKADKEKMRSRCTCRHRRGTTFSCGCEKNASRRKNLDSEQGELDSSKSRDNGDDDRACNCSRG